MVKKVFTGILDLLLLAVVILIAVILARYAWLHFYKAAYPVKYDAAVMRHSESTGVSPSLILAVIRTESGFNPSAQSNVPARGLMQITLKTFEWIRYRLGEDGKYDYDDMFDGETNIYYGSQLLRLLLLEFGSDNNALCAYHAGWGGTHKWLDNPDYTVDGEIVSIPSSTTRHYVKKVLAAKNIYEALYQLEASSDPN